MGHFKVKSKIHLNDLKIGDRIEESDFTTVSEDGHFIQLEFIASDEDDNIKTDVKPGIWSIDKNMAGLYLKSTEFVTDAFLESFLYTKEISEKVDCFFRNLHVYKEFGFDIPKRGVLLYGTAGSGKTSSIIKVVRDYATDGKTAILIWDTDKFEASTVKQFIKNFNYIGVERLIFIAEDLGGMELDGHRFMSESSLLSLLDNQEKTFSIPVLIIATTNHPENFLGNITNRPSRFDDKIEVNAPPPEARAELLKFFYKKEVPKEALELIKGKNSTDFTPAHIKEVVIRAALHEKDLVTTIKEIHKEIEHYKKAFTSRTERMGL